MNLPELGSVEAVVGKTFDWIIRTDPDYAHWAIELEVTDQLDGPMCIFAHYCMENADMALLHKSRPIKKADGPCDMVLTTFTGTGKNLRTGGMTVDLFSVRALEISEHPRRFRGYTIDKQALLNVIKKISKGELSLDTLSWLWNSENYLITPNNEIYHFGKHD